MTHDFGCSSCHSFDVEFTKHHLSKEISFESYPHLPVAVLFEPFLLGMELFFRQALSSFIQHPNLEHLFFECFFSNRYFQLFQPQHHFSAHHVVVISDIYFLQSLFTPKVETDFSVRRFDEGDFFFRVKSNE